MSPHYEVKFFPLTALNEIFSYLPFYVRWPLFIPYNISYSLIEFPIENDNFVPSAGIFPLASENTPYLYRYSGSFSYFQKIPY